MEPLMTRFDTEFDVHDISDLVTPVVAESALLRGTALPGFTNGRSFFFTEEQVRRLAEEAPAGRLCRRAGGGWEEAVPRSGIRYLAERRINGTIHYRFGRLWEFRVTAS
jgi:hypothetical protein